MGFRERFNRVQLIPALVVMTVLGQLCLIYNQSGALRVVSIENQEKWENLAMNSVPASVRHWFTYSSTEAARLSTLEGDDPEVISHIRKYKLIPIPPKLLRTHWKAKNNTRRKQAPVIIDILKQKKNGFFIEAGAYDGLIGSKTFFIERELNWSGLLIEADPNSFAQAVEKKRNAYLVPACLSTTTKPQLMTYGFGWRVGSKLVAEGESPHIVKVQCLPLYSILLAINQTTVDLFSLDIEGNELDVLMTIPFDKINIKVLIVEWLHTYQGKEALVDFRTSKGYINYPSTAVERMVPKWASEDFIFVKKGIGLKETRDGL